MERERLEARQAPRWSDAEAAENRARRLWLCEKGFGGEARTSSHNQLLVGRFEDEGSCSAWGRRLQSVLLLESVSCGGLKNRLAQWRAALGRDPCNLGEQALAERTARRFALQGGRDAIGSKTEEEANS